uniref:IST1-like protein n=1 Tax=Anthurium amnicola TaxID=1678845 RepID=A0A1D1ZIH1_9ARAE
MLDSLLGRKFTAKCKHAIKCIYDRLKPIRNRKQAMANILRKDIADLLSRGNDAHAFSRMDGLIVDINRLACYNMIEKFCECVLKQLPLLQKQRECPLEDREAVSTLIYAAARFSDLPELCDLRHVFTVRYGSAMETSVNPEFKEKSASKAFSVAGKLQLMEDIASEFSIKWDSTSFEHRITNPTASKCDHRKKGDKPQDPKAVPVGEEDGMLNHVMTEAKDIHAISQEPEPPRKTKKVWADEPENATASPIDSSNFHLKPEKNKGGDPVEDRQRKNDTYRMSLGDREVLDPIHQEGKVVEQQKPKDEHRARSAVPLDWELNGTRPSRARVGSKPIGQQANIMEQLKSKDESRAANSASVYVPQESSGIDAKESHDILCKRSSMAKMDYKGERQQAVGQQEFHDNDQPTKIPQYGKVKDITDIIGSDGPDEDGVVYERSATAKQEVDHTAQEGQMVERQKFNDVRAFHLIPPPYVKPAVSKVGAKSEHANSSGRPTITSKSNNDRYEDLPKDDLVVDDEKPKPRSVRRKQQKPPVVQEIDNFISGDDSVHQIPHGQRRRSSRQNTIPPQDDCEEKEIAMDRLLMHYSKKGMPDQSSKLRTKIQALPTDHALHDGGTRQYQTNGRHQINKLETEQAVPADHVIDNGEAREHKANRRYRIPKAESVLDYADHVVRYGEAVVDQTSSRHRAHRPESLHLPERAVSLPPDPVSPKEMVKGHARATSMQSDSSISPGGRMHPRLPDYEELATRFAALRKG